MNKCVSGRLALHVWAVKRIRPTKYRKKCCLINNMDNDDIHRYQHILISIIRYYLFTIFSSSSIPVSPESIVIPIVSCIFGFPLLALLVICCLRRRAKLARERDRRRNYDLQDHAVSLVRFSPIHRLCESKCQLENSKLI